MIFSRSAKKRRKPTILLLFIDLKMNNNLKRITAGLLLAAGALFLSAAARDDISATRPFMETGIVSDQKPAPAKTLYLNNCARCHGADGRGTTELGKLYGATDLTQKKVKRMSRKKAARIIQNGDGSMPAFNKKLSAKEISTLVSFIRGL